MRRRMFTFTVPGQPQPLHRHRTCARGGKPRQYDDPRNAGNREAVAWAARAAGVRPRSGPVRMVCTFALERPKTVTRQRPTVKPDIDNYLKLVLDALNGVAWKDDAQVVRVSAIKCYDPRNQPCTVVTVEYLEDEPCAS